MSILRYSSPINYNVPLHYSNQNSHKISIYWENIKELVQRHISCINPTSDLDSVIYSINCFLGEVANYYNLGWLKYAKLSIVDNWISGSEIEPLYEAITPKREINLNPDMIPCYPQYVVIDTKSFPKLCPLSQYEIERLKTVQTENLELKAKLAALSIDDPLLNLRNRVNSFQLK